MDQLTTNSSSHQTNSTTAELNADDTLEDWNTALKGNLQIKESILSNFDFFVFPIFTIKLCHFKAQTIFSYAINTQA